MVVAVARAVESGARARRLRVDREHCRLAAAYAARAGLDAVVLTPAGATATAKRAQAVVAGARLIELRGSFDDALRICRELGARPGFVLVNSLNPDRIEGQKSRCRRAARAARRAAGCDRAALRRRRQRHRGRRGARRRRARRAQSSSARPPSAQRPGRARFVSPSPRMPSTSVSSSPPVASRSSR